MSETEAQRLDIWLCNARAFKSRSLSAAFIKKRGVRITRCGSTRKIAKPGATVGVGDIVTFGRRDDIRIMRVLGFAERRGPPAEAMTLYQLIEDDT